MKKRLLSMFLCLCMLLTMVPAALAAGTTGTAAPADGRRRRDQRESDYRKHHDIDDRELCP